jgi:hypothetical protein
MDQGNNAGRDGCIAKGKTMLPMAETSSNPPAAISSPLGKDLDPYPLSLASPTSSLGTQDSRYDAFSPPPMGSQYYWAPDAPPGNSVRGSQDQVPIEDQPRANSENSQPNLHNVGNTDVTGENMECDDQAMAPASKAPRAP